MAAITLFHHIILPTCHRAGWHLLLREGSEGKRRDTGPQTGGALASRLGVAATVFLNGVPAPAEVRLAAGLSFLLLWVFHEALPTGCVEFSLVDSSVIVSIDLCKVHDVGSGVCLR